LTPADVAVQEELAALFGQGPIKALSLSGRVPSHVPRCVFSDKFGLSASLLSLDLSRNKLCELPAAIGGLSSLTELNVGRNWLKALPAEIGQLSHLEKLDALSNKLRPNSLSLDALATLPRLRLLDLRYNDKLGDYAATLLARRLPSVECHVTSLVPFNDKLHAADRDASVLRSQLEPHCTPTMRRRLALVLGEATDPATVTREEVMRRLLAYYAKAGPRLVRNVYGVPVAPALCGELLREMQAWVKADELRPAERERPTIRAQHYMILRSPAEFTDNTTRKAVKAAHKLERYMNLWTLARRAIEEVDADFASRYTAVAFTNNFEGSPHIDTQNIGPFYGMALGDFSEGGGALCVECSAHEVAHVDTRNRLGKVDGRYPHWVAPYTGDRYSVIFYQTMGEPAVRTTAVFSGEPLVDDPLTFCSTGYQYQYCPDTKRYFPCEDDKRFACAKGIAFGNE